MKTKNIKQKIKEHFLLYPTAKARIRQLERELKLPLPSIIRYVKELEKDGIVKSEIISRVKLYSADRSSKKFLLEKRLFNINSLYSSGFVDSIVQQCHNPVLILFGSYAIGEDIEKSDIDIYIEAPIKKIVDIAIFEKKLKRKFQIFYCK